MGRAAPGAAANKRVFAQRAAQSDGDSMETRGLRGSIGRSCRATAPGSCHRRSRHRPGRCRDPGVPCVRPGHPDVPTPDRGPRDHPRPDTPALSPSHAAHTLSTFPTEEDRRWGVGSRSAARAGLGEAGPGTCGSTRPCWTGDDSQWPESPARREGTGGQRLRLSFPWRNKQCPVQGGWVAASKGHLRVFQVPAARF